MALNNNLKPYYNNIEIAKIIKSCNNIDELKKAGHLIVDLHIDYEIIDVRFFEAMAHKRIRHIV